MTEKNILELIKNRRAIKEFDDTHTMPESDLEQLKTAIHFTPTAFNIQNYRFVIVQDKEFRHSKDFVEACWGQESKVADSSALFILCADKEAWADNPERYWTTVDENTKETLVGMIQNYYEGQDRVKLDEAHRSCGMAGMTIMLAAQAMGYDTCPMDGFDYDKVGQLINLPKDHVISFMVAVGKRKKDPFPKPTFIDRDEVFIKEKFSV